MNTIRDQKQRKLRAWDQETEKLETSLVPRDTLCETPTIKTVITSLLGFHAVIIQ